MGRRRKGREYALQILYQIDLTDGSPDQVFEDFWASQDVRDDVREFAEALVRGTHRSRGTLDEAIEIAKRFGLEDSGGFINGILDSIRRRLERGEVTLE